MSVETAYQFLTAIMGDEGSSALQKACERSSDLKTVMVPRAVMSWLRFIGPRGYEGAIPGTAAKLKLSKTEDLGSAPEPHPESYAGEVEWNGNTYQYQDASLFQIAAAVALAIGAKAREVNTGLRTDELAALGKSVDVLVKAHAATEQLRKADPTGATAKPRPQQPPGLPGAPTAAKIGGAAAPKPPAAVGPPQPAAGAPGLTPPKPPKLPGMGKKGAVAIAPKLPALKVGKSELSTPCSMCGNTQFTGEKFTGCTCLKALAKSVKSTTKPDGVLLTFGSAWDREDVQALMKLMRGDE